MDRDYETDKSSCEELRHLSRTLAFTRRGIPVNQVDEAAYLIDDATVGFTDDDIDEAIYRAQTRINRRTLLPS